MGRGKGLVTAEGVEGAEEIKKKMGFDLTKRLNSLLKKVLYVIITKKCKTKRRMQC